MAGSVFHGYRATLGYAQKDERFKMESVYNRLKITDPSIERKVIHDPVR